MLFAAIVVTLAFIAFALIAIGNIADIDWLVYAGVWTLGGMTGCILIGLLISLWSVALG